MAWITSRNKLTLEQMRNNATEFYNAMSANGWSLNAIAGVLGNMQWESSINAGVIEGFLISSLPPNKGYGLIQWTDSHATDVRQNPLWKWVYENYGDYEWDNPERQCVFINGDDEAYWIARPNYKMSYGEFKVSEESPDYLAKAYFYNRERGTWFDARANSAVYWYEFLSGQEPPTPPDPPEPPEPSADNLHKMPIWMYPCFKHNRK